MQKYPKIKFIFGLKADTDNAINFLGHRRTGQYKRFVRWFLPDDLKYILNKKYSKKQKNEIIKSYTKKVYKEKRLEIANGVGKVISDWKRVEDGYYKLVDRIFKNYPWPKGDYRGFASIFWMYPRYIDQKIFFFPYTHRIPRFANKVIVHEMLHFIFFDYIDKRYGLKYYSKIKGRPGNYIWQVSEVFNNVMEAWPTYKKISGDQARPYPGTEKMFARMKKQWSQKQDIDWLLDQWLMKKYER